MADQRQGIAIDDLSEVVAPLGWGERPDLIVKAHIIRNGEDLTLPQEVEEIGDRLLLAPLELG